MVRFFFIFLSVPNHNVWVVGYRAMMLWVADFLCLFPSRLTWFFWCHYCFWILYHHIFHAVVFWGKCLYPPVTLSSVCVCVCVCVCMCASDGDFKKSSFFLMNGFSNSSVIFSSCFLCGIQFLGDSSLVLFIVHSSNTSSLMQSFSAKVTTWSFGYYVVCLINTSSDSIHTLNIK